MDTSTEDTLPDDAWKDSFDKLLDQRPILRELNVIKRDVRASFNMNSSYENSSLNNNTVSSKIDCEEQSLRLVMSLSTRKVSNNIQYLDAPGSTNRNKRFIKSKAVSTPIKSNSANPFKCTLSPIGSWHLQHFNCINNKRESKKKDNNVCFSATPINNKIVFDIENIGDKNSPNTEKEMNRTRYSLGISPFAIVKNKWKSKQNKKNVCFATADLDEKEPKNSENFIQGHEKLVSSPICLTYELQPGKWRKSVNCLRRKENPIREYETNQETLKKHRIGRSTDVRKQKSLAAAISFVGNRKSIPTRPDSNKTQAESRSTYSLESNDFKRQLLQRCGQRRLLTFENAYNEEYLINCCKIGEGAFGEVFLYSKTNSDTRNTEKTVLKIIPIAGKQLVNGEIQKNFEQILPEVIISMELSGLKNNSRKTNVTSGFVNLQRVRCVKGKYPSHLQKLWEEYDLKKESENDHPKCFISNQVYIVLELAYGGQDLEGFHFKNAEQSFSVLQQIILTLAVGEKEYQFEHRDLHWGNILVLNTNEQFISYKIDENILTIPTKGIQMTIIDYTLSRMTLNDHSYYYDLSNDEELFTATGDYQFEIYRMMRTALNDKWESFEPKTNIFWISYIISKFVDGVKYKNTRSKNHLRYLDKLKKLQSTILTYKSCEHCARDVLAF